MMELVHFIAQDVQHFIGTIIFVAVVGEVVEGIIKALKK